MRHIAKLKRAKPERVEWDPRKMKYNRSSGRYCRVECREAFDNGVEPYAAKQPLDRCAA